MNRQVFTLMTVFLMLGAVWGNSAKAAGQDKKEEIYTELGNQTTLGSRYYLIGDGQGNFLKAADKNGDNFTILSNQTIKLDKNSSEQDILSAQWAIEPVQLAGSTIVSGYKLKNKKTGHYLKFFKNGDFPAVNDDPDINTFSWFGSDKKYNTNGEILYIDKTENLGIVIDNSGSDKYTVKIATSSLTSLHVFTLDDDDMSAEELNQQMRNGFILAAKKSNVDIKVEDNGLLNKKLVAFSFYVETKYSKENDNVHKIIGEDPHTLQELQEDKDREKRLYLAVSGYEDLMNYVETEGGYTINIKEENKDDKGNTLWEAKDVIAAFKKATFVAVDKTRNYTPIESKIGLGYRYATFTGEDLLNADGKDVPIENAQFNIKNNPSLGSTSTSDYLIITNPYALFPNDNGSMNQPVKKDEEIVGVRPYVKENEDTENKKYYLTSAPANGNYAWTQIGFASGGGIVNNYDHFKGKKYIVTIADKEIIDTENVPYPNESYPYVSIYGWLINPSTGSYKNDDGNYKSNLTFEEPTTILANKPEGQWIFQYDEEQDIFLMYNRESSQYFALGKTIYKVNNSNDLYYIPGGIKGHVAGSSESFTIDTLRLTTTTLGGFDGYAHSKKTGDEFDAVTLKNTAYKLGIQNGTFDNENNFVYVQNSLTHNNTLVVDVKSDDGLFFYLVPCDTVSYGIPGYYDTKEEKPIDNLKRIKYALQERTTKRYVVYDPIDKKFMLDSKDDYKNVDEALKAAEKFFFKEKDNNKYVLLHCEGYYEDKDEKEWIDKTTKKVYANIGDAFLHQIDMYTKDIADQFRFKSDVSPMFEDILRKLKGDNDTSLVKINLYSVQNRSGNQKYMLAAGENNFLTEGIPDTRSDIIINSKAIGGLSYDSIKFSIIVDTAYVRRTKITEKDEDGKTQTYISSVMPLYYLGMSSLNEEENVVLDSIGPLHKWDEDIFHHPIQCKHYLEYTRGNFLFAMTDSIYHGMDKKIQREDHCYHYWNTHNPRLRFVHANHIGDTMIVSSIRPASKDTMRAGYITTTIEASKEQEWLAPQVEGGAGSPNYGLFAFEVNPNPSDPDVPEYALWNPASRKYVAYLNGNLIIADQPSYYTLDVKREGHSIVSNEMARTSDVRVIASQGKVIIQHAAGKKAFLQTALGKTIADVVLTSDQEEITAPAGIVFVTVEGEETEKTIVK